MTDLTEIPGSESGTRRSRGLCRKKGNSMRYTRTTSLVVAAALLAVCLAAPGIAEAQGTGRSFKIGAKGGWTSTKVRGDATTDFDTPITFKSGNGFSLGGLIALPIHPNAAVQVEAMYTRKNVGANTELLEIPATGEFDLDFFEIPVFVKLHLARDQGVVPFILVGPTFSFLTRAIQTLTLAGISGESDIKNDLVSVDVGMALALGADFFTSWGAVTAEIRYNYGFTNLDADGSNDIKQGSFMVLGGVIF